MVFKNGSILYAGRENSGPKEDFQYENTSARLNPRLTKKNVPMLEYRPDFYWLLADQMGANRNNCCSSMMAKLTLAQIVAIHMHLTLLLSAQHGMKNTLKVTSNINIFDRFYRLSVASFLNRDDTFLSAASTVQARCFYRPHCMVTFRLLFC